MTPSPMKRCAEAARVALEDECLPPPAIARAVLEEFRNWLLDDTRLDARRLTARYVASVLDRK